MNKEKAVEIIDKVCQAKKIMDDVYKDIVHCSKIEWINVYNKDDFEELCKALDVNYTIKHSCDFCYYSAEYNGLGLICADYKKGGEFNE